MSYLSGAVLYSPTTSSASNPWSGGNAPGGYKPQPLPFAAPKPKPKPPAVKPPVVAANPVMPVLLPAPKPQAPPPIAAKTPAQPSPVAPSATSSGGGGGGGGASGGFVPGDAMANAAPVSADTPASTGFSVSPLVLGIGAVALYFILSRRR
jgi:hypothetical protein